MVALPHDMTTSYYYYEENNINSASDIVSVLSIIDHSKGNVRVVEFDVEWLGM